MNNIYPFFTALTADGSRIATGRSCITKDDKVYIDKDDSLVEVMPETLMCEMRCVEEEKTYDLP